MSSYRNEKGNGEIAAAARASDVVASRSSAAVCINCRSSLKNESDLAQRIKVCAACLTIYARIDDAITLANENR